MQLLKQSTAASRMIGPILDSAGAVYTGAVIGDLNITKNGTTAAMAAAATLVHDHNGHYVLTFTTGNTDTLGSLTVTCNKSTYAMTAFRWTVLRPAVFEAMFTNGGLGIGTCGSGCTTTSIVTSSLSPAASVADQFKGRVIIFDYATTSANLRGQGALISAMTSGGVLTVSALTDAPASGDTFSIL